MAALYPHRIHGWQVVYYIYFPDGTRKRKNKLYASKHKALIGLHDIEKLETFSLKGLLTPAEIPYFLHKKFLLQEEAAKLLPNTAPALPSWQIAWDALADVYFKHVRKEGSEMTRRSYPYKIRPILKFLESLPPEKLTKDDIDRYIAHRRETAAQATVNKEITALRIMLDRLVELGVWKKNPAREIKLFSHLPKRLPTCFPPEDVKRILRDSEDYYACGGYFPEIIRTYLYTGLRRYELLTLRRRHVDLTKQALRVIGKGDKERIIDLHPALLNEVFPSVILKNGPRKGEYFFGGNDTPLMTHDSLSRAFRIFLRRHDIYNENSLHTLRHTFISYMIEAGVSLPKVKDIAGHDTILTTMKYTHIVNNGDRPIHQLDYDGFAARKHRLEKGLEKRRN